MKRLRTSLVAGFAGVTKRISHYVANSVGAFVGPRPVVAGATELFLPPLEEQIKLRHLPSNWQT